MTDRQWRLIRHVFFRWYARAKVPCLHDTQWQYFRVSTNFSNADSNIFLIHVQKSKFSICAVLEIRGLKVVISFNFALITPQVKQHIKYCEPWSAATIKGMFYAATLYIYTASNSDRKQNPAWFWPVANQQAFSTS